MTAMLRGSVVVVVIDVRTRPRAMPLAVITMRKSTHGFLFLSYMGMGLRLTTLRAAGAPLIYVTYLFLFYQHKNLLFERGPAICQQAPSLEESRRYAMPNV